MLHMGNAACNRMIGYQYVNCMPDPLYTPVTSTALLLCILCNIFYLIERYPMNVSIATHV